jgi:hypothetical protein
MKTMLVEDVVARLEEMLHNHIKVALKPQEKVHEQYMNLGIVEGIKCSIRRLEQIGREV